MRGVRIELGEVAAALADAAGVRQAVVVDDRSGDVVRLVGYVTPDDGEVDPAAVRAHAATRLPEHMVPALVMMLDGPVPLTPNGKLDRRALPAPDLAAMVSTDDGPLDDDERRLAALVGEVLGLPAGAGAGDDFFALGGHSMAAMRLLARVRAAFGRELAVRDVFEAPTVRALARRVTDAPRARPALVPAGEHPTEGPVAPSQRWRLSRGLTPRPDHTLTLAGPFDPDTLDAALDDVVARHAPLRTVFSADGTTRYVRARGPAVTREEASPEELAARPFDLTDEPAFRAHLVDSGALVLVMGHVTVDEWSVVPLLRDLATAYAARRDDRAPDWRPLAVTYDDYARWAATLPGADDGPDPSLAGLPTGLGLAAGDPRDDRAATLTTTIPAEDRRRLDALARRHGASLLMVLQAALATGLRAAGAGTDLPLVGHASGRTEPALDDLVGGVSDLVVLRTDLSGDPSPDALVDRVRAADLAAFARAEVPFVDVAALTGLTRPPVVLVQHEEPTLEREESVLGALDAAASGHVDADLTLSFAESAPGRPLALELTHRLAAWSPEAARTLLDGLAGYAR